MAADGAKSANENCLICFSELTTRGKTPCNHNDICGRCHLRMRHLHDDRKCPICKTTNETIIVDADPEKPFDDYPIWGDELGAGFVYRESVGMHFESAYYDSEIQPLFGYECKVCDFAADEGPACKKAPTKILQEHLRKEHRMSLCNLCVDNKRDFVTCLPRFTPSQLQNHLRDGDGPDSGFYGHPVCEFCKPKRFYDLAALHQHLHKEHYECHICKKQGLENQFFKNYKSLEKHFDKQHFLCQHPNCLAARFIVFENEIDLRAHEIEVHGASSTGSTKITVEFQTRRAGFDGSGVGQRQETPSESDFNYGLDGQAFVPDALPNRPSSGNNEMHPQHAQRTEELRAQAAEMREQQAARDQVDSFPTLQSSNAQASSSAPLVGWASDSTVQRLQGGRKKNAGKVTNEDFPTLPTAPNAKINAKKKAIRGKVGAARRQFAAMQTTGSTPSYGNAAAARARAPLSTPGFPAGPRTALNQKMNLSSENFPSLGARTRPAPYAAANSYAKRNQKGQTNYPSLSSAEDFPSMAGAKATTTPAGGKKNKSIRDKLLGNSSVAAASPHQAAANVLRTSTSAFPPMASTKPAPASRKKQPYNQAPSISNMAEFPSPPLSSGSSKKKSVRQAVLGNADTSSSSHQAMENVLQPPTKSATATIEEMKATMGQKKFKQLKRMTRDFAGGLLSPEGYIDQSALLFDKGYDDPDFWSYLPSVIESCPDELMSQRALSYMTSLKQKEQSNLVKKTNSLAAAPSSSWGTTNNVRANNVLKAPPQAKNVAQRKAAPPAARPYTVTSKKKNNAWGAAGQSTAMKKTKPPPGSVSSAAASQGPQNGSATKSMAKQQKKKNPTQKQQTGKKKKKERDELRALAFGK